MVIEPLSKEMICAGRKLTERLEKTQMPINASLWLYFSEAELWRLVIASTTVEALGPKKAYGIIQSELRAAPDLFQSISLSGISAVEPNSPLISPFRKVKRAPSPPIGVRVSRVTFNGVFVEGAYIYKLT